jgi:hypothetical protein
MLLSAQTAFAESQFRDSQRLLGGPSSPRDSALALCITETFCLPRESKLQPRGLLELGCTQLFSREDIHVRTILLILLILLLLGALPTWPYSTGWGYYPSGGLGLVLVIVLILVLAKRI